MLRYFSVTFIGRKRESVKRNIKFCASFICSIRNCSVCVAYSMLALLSNTAANCCKLCVHGFLKKHLLKGVRPIYCSSKGSQRHWHCGLSLNCSNDLYNAGRYCPKQQHVFCTKTNLSKGKSCTGLLRKKFFWKTETYET